MFYKAALGSAFVCVKHYAGVCEGTEGVWRVVLSGLCQLVSRELLDFTGSLCLKRRGFYGAQTDVPVFAYGMMKAAARIIQRAVFILRSTAPRALTRRCNTKPHVENYLAADEKPAAVPYDRFGCGVCIVVISWQA